MKGIILAGGSGTRLYPLTEDTSKQLLPVYDKKMIYYPLSTLMQAGIKDILLISTLRDTPRYMELFGDGSAFGINIEYKMQPSPDGLAQAFTLGERFIGNDDVAMILGDNIFYSPSIAVDLEIAQDDAKKGYGTIFCYDVKDLREAKRFGIAELDENSNVISLVEKPKEPLSTYAVTGLYFYDNRVVDIAKNIQPSARGEYEITDVNKVYLNELKALKALVMESDYKWIDTGTFDSLVNAAVEVRDLQQQNNTLIAYPELIALDNGWITEEEIGERIHRLKLYKSDYGKNIMKNIGIEIKE